MLELPADFPHQSPDNYSYKVEQFKTNVHAIWLQHHKDYVYSSDPVCTIWGFFNAKKRQYFAPINAKKLGKVVDIKNTTPYTSMQINLNPLEHALYSKN